MTAHFLPNRVILPASMVLAPAMLMFAASEIAGWQKALLIFFGMALAVSAGFLGFRRYVLRPLDVLLVGAERLGAGHYGERVAPLVVGAAAQLHRLAWSLDHVAAAAEGRDRVAAALAEERARLSLALEAGGLAAWELNRGTGVVERSPRHDALFGYSVPRGAWNWRDFLDHVVPEDRNQVKRLFRRALRGAVPLSLEFRIHRAGDGDVRWLEALGALHQAADGTSKFLGVLSDVTERRRAEQRLRLAVGELNHRVKNMLSSVQSIAAQTLRAPPESNGDVPAAARKTFEARLLALSRSHEVLTREGWTGADVGELVALALAPHSAGISDRPRHVVVGPPLRVPQRFVVPLSVALHELASNSARHGALTVPTGQVEISWKLVPESHDVAATTLKLRWAESGGPPVPGPPLRRGFGTRLLERGLAGELGGTVHLHFHPTGVVCEIEAPLHPAGTAAAAMATAAA